ncbi:M23 family metallopeptidase [Aquabacterium sp.]|uniref:M23 family metallopeptidase n=1 Tax=Aquabacterium sp. TaxID=1872578 RepID=UPI002C2834D9|nr:M23 family metallopeptidase [Aquabacterium sp.]HSW06490.1 M23 family metallopeptidase [Aquabacterium sp.]
MAGLPGACLLSLGLLMAFSPASAQRSAAAGLSAVAPGSLRIPVLGVEASMIQDHFDEVRGAQRHEALDIMAPRGTPVVAVADGRVAKLFTSKPGGLTVYQFDSSGRFAFYYAHLDRYAHGLKEGALLKRGDAIGAVGSTGNALPDAPHLHFAVFRLGPGREWWKGTPLNPYPMLVGRHGPR